MAFAIERVEPPEKLQPAAARATSRPTAADGAARSTTVGRLARHRLAGIGGPIADGRNGAGCRCVGENCGDLEPERIMLNVERTVHCLGMVMMVAMAHW